MPNCRRISAWLLGGLFLVSAGAVRGQIDPYTRSLVQLGYDQPLAGTGPQGVYAYYYYNTPQIHGTNMSLRLAVAPAYVDGELGFKQLISQYTDVGLGFYGGAFSDNYYEVRQGRYFQSESFDGYGGGIALSVYNLMNPGMLVPLNLILRGGANYTSYGGADGTSPAFTLPANHYTLFTRAGLRLAGKEPILYPALAMELSIWFERQWRTDPSSYGYGGDRSLAPASDLFWIYGCLDYTFTNTGQQVSFAVTAAGSKGADRFSAWRLGGVLPLISEFPLELPGYFYEELTARRLLHLYASYLIPLDHERRFDFRVEAATAHLDYLPGFEQPEDWQTGAGCDFEFTPKDKTCRIVLRYGYGFNAERHGHEGAHSVGLLLEYDFERRLKNKHERQEATN